MHPPQPQIPLRAHPEMLLAAGTERRIRYAGYCAEVRHIQSLIGVGLQDLFQAPHHRGVMAMSAAHIDWISARETPNHCFDQRLFHRPRYLGLGEDVRGGLREMARRLIKRSFLLSGLSSD